MSKSIVGSYKKVYFISKSIACLMWGLAIADITTNSLLWLMKKDEMVYGIISAINPDLLNQNFELSTASLILIIVFDYIPLLISSAGLFFVGYFFFFAAKGEIWSDKNIKALFIGGMLTLLSPLIYGLLDLFQSLAISLSLPDGERFFVFYAGLSSTAIRDIVFGIMILSLSLIMREAKKINDENQLYI